MQNLRDIEHESLVASLDAIGGEPLAGSGFEAEEDVYKRQPASRSGCALDFTSFFVPHSLSRYLYK